MAKHLPPKKTRQIKLPELKMPALPRLFHFGGRPLHLKTYEREFTASQAIFWLIGLLLFLFARFLPMGNRARTVFYLFSALVAAYPMMFAMVKKLLMRRLPDEDILVLLAVLLAFCLRAPASAALAMLLYRLGQLAEAYVTTRSAAGVELLRDSLPAKAKVEREYGLEETVPENVEIGDILIIEPYEVFPVDGQIVEGMTTVDTSPITGSSTNLNVAAGGEVLSGCVNRSTTVRVRATRRFDDSAAARLLASLTTADDKLTDMEKLLARVVRYFTPCVVILALLLGIILPLFHGSWAKWLYRAAILLLLCSPSAAVISVPLSYLGAMMRAKRRGIRIKSALLVELFSKATTFLFGKTGTITEGKYTITDVFPNGVSEQDLLKVAAAAESYSRHPIGEALKQAAGWTSDMLDSVMEVEEIPGRGISAFIEGRHVYVGNASLLEDHKIWYAVPSRAGAAIHVAVENQYWGHIMISDRIREGAFDTLEELRNQGADNIVMLTGDVLSVTRPIAAALNFDLVRAGLSPAAKLSSVKFLMDGKAAGTSVAYVGDGFNDAPMLEAADVGITINALDAWNEMDAADVAIMDDDLRLLPEALKMTVTADHIVKQNMIFIGAVKAILLVLAVIGVLPLSIAALCDAAAAILVCVNSLRAFGTE